MREGLKLNGKKNTQKLWAVKYELGIRWAKKGFRLGVYLALIVIVLGGFGAMCAKSLEGVFYYSSGVKARK